MQLALAQFIQYDGSREEQILANEDKLDTYEDRLGGYLVQISQHGTSSADMRTVSRLLHAIGDFERIGDHALNLQESAKELHEKQLAFSPIAREEVDVLTSLLEDLLNSALRSFQSDDPQMARRWNLWRRLWTSLRRRSAAVTSGGSKAASAPSSSASSSMIC